jgi:hypothetical protein
MVVVACGPTLRGEPGRPPIEGEVPGARGEIYINMKDMPRTSTGEGAKRPSINLRPVESNQLE